MELLIYVLLRVCNNYQEIQESATTGVSSHNNNPAPSLGCVNEYPTMRFWKSKKHSINDSIYDFVWVFPEKNVL